jgi:hypothetical protein
LGFLDFVVWDFFPLNFVGEKWHNQCLMQINQRKQEEVALKMLAFLVQTRNDLLWVTHNNMAQSHHVCCYVG